jgi:hypothetical protein
MFFRRAAPLQYSHLPHVEYKIVSKEIYDDWYLKQQSVAVFVTCHAILHLICRLSVLRGIHHPSRYFTVYLLSVTLLHAQKICVIIKGLAACGKT